MYTHTHTHTHTYIYICLCVWCFIFLRYIKLGELFNAKAIFVEEQLWYFNQYLGIKGVHACPKVNIIVQLKFELDVQISARRRYLYLHHDFNVKDKLEAEWLLSSAGPLPDEKWCHWQALYSTGRLKPVYAIIRYPYLDSCLSPRLARLIRLRLH